MPTVDIVRSVDISRSTRCRQLEAMFDVPPQEKCELKWSGNIPIENKEWNIGLIVGPSGSGKTTIAKEIFGNQYFSGNNWKSKAVIDDFNKKLSIKEISEICSAVGFNTIPAWFRPYSVLSTGEKFRVDIARSLSELNNMLVVDEFTSVIDRHVAKIGSHAIQKYIRKNKKKFVAVTCHYDVIEWLRPDWIFEPSTMEYKPRGSLQQRPKINVEIKKVTYDAWQLFAPYHYLTASLNKAARCYGMFCEGRIIAFVAIIHKPNPHKKNIKGISRIVTLPDWQGLALGPILAEKICSAYYALGYEMKVYPAHPSLIRAAMRHPAWKLTKKPGLQQKTSKGIRAKANPNKVCRPCAVFKYVGPKMDIEKAKALINSRPCNDF